MGAFGSAASRAKSRYLKSAARRAFSRSRRTQGPHLGGVDEGVDSTRKRPKGDSDTGGVAKARYVLGHCADELNRLTVHGA
ncbi:hypothetical protein MB901379_00662 [Mycobacterium basiliense]|uniref:Uncharacterized protein n=1 Tax=Mycobacterium basiliense TaxID=2094119 RepID=A0A3S4CSZ7_9MYCO|nr:hypothetical protein MB901379_00662 [Mycobacterium basiliense]